MTVIKNLGRHNNATPPGRMHANQLKTGQLQQLQLTPVRPVMTTGQTGAQQSPEMARNHLKTFLMRPACHFKLKFLPLDGNA
jgi:hypothetical protein